MPKFDPYPEDAEVHDSFATVPLDDYDGEDDGDDSLTPHDEEPIVTRLMRKVRRG